MQHAKVRSSYHAGVDIAKAIGKYGLIHGGFYYAYRLAARLGSPDPAFNHFIGMDNMPLIPELLDVVSVWGKMGSTEVRDTFSIDGVEIKVPDFGFMRPSADLYAVGDMVSVLVCVPTKAGHAIEIEVKVNGNVVNTEKASINKEGGLAILRLQNLAPGTYTLTFADKNLGELSYSFIVADFALAMLSFRDVQFSMIPDTDSVKVNGQLMRPGDDPLAGTKVKFELMENGRRRDTSWATTSDEGHFEVELQLDGATQGLSVFAQVQQQGGSDLTAEYRLPGTAQSQREVTPVTSFMGQLYGITLVPVSPDDTGVNGVYIVPMEVSNSVITADNIIGEEVQLRVNGMVPALTITVFDPFRKKYEIHEHRNLNPDSTITVPVLALWSVILLGGWSIQGDKFVPFSAYTSAFKASPLELTLDMDMQVPPGEPFSLRVATNMPLQQLSVAVFGNDVRVTHTPALVHAATVIKDRAAKVRDQLGNDQPGAYTLAHALGVHQDPSSRKSTYLEPQRWVGDRRVSGPPDDPFTTMRGGSLGGRVDPSQIGSFGPPSRRDYGSDYLGIPGSTGADILGSMLEDAVVKGPVDSGIATASREQLVVEDIRSRQPSTFFAGGLLVFGEAEMRIVAPTDIGEYTVTAFSFDRETFSWAETTLRFSVTKPVYVKAIVPTYLAQGSAYRLRMLVSTLEGAARIGVFYNNVELPVTDIAGKPIDSTNLQTPANYFVTLVGPGDLDITLEDPITGATDRVQYRINAPDRVKTRYTRRTLINPGESITADELGAITMWAEPGLDLTVHMLTTGLMGFEGKCIQQSSEMLLAAVHNIIASGGSGAAVNYFLRLTAYIRRMIPGDGHKYAGDFMFYPGYPPDQYYSLAAAWNMYNLDMYTDRSFQKVLPSDVQTEIIFLRNKGRMYLHRRGLLHNDGLPINVTCGRDLYIALQHGFTRQETVAFIGRYLAKEGDNYRIIGTLPTYAHGATVVRAELAYLAASMVMWKMWDAAIPLASHVLSQVRERGLAHSSADTLPILLMINVFSALDFGKAQSWVTRNSGRITLQNLLDDGDTFKSFTAGDQPVVIGYTVDEERTWSDMRFTKQVQVAIINRDGQHARALPVGQRAKVVITLPQGYEAGDMVRLVTPPNLVITMGGGQIQNMDVDLQGQATVEVEVMAIAPTVDGHQDVLAVLVWNMFDEEKAGNPGLIQFTITRR